MGKHFMTVCVFCFLCATHSPCSSHVQISSNEKRIDNGENNLMKLSDKYQIKKPPFHKITNLPDNNELLTINDSDHIIHDINKSSNKRKKRDINRQRKIDDALYIKKIFTSFGNGDSMNYTGFEQFIRTLHLERLLNDSIEMIAPTPINGNHVSCVDSKSLLKSITNEQYSNSTLQSEPFIDATSLKKLCPVLLYQLVAPTSVERQGCVLPVTTNDTHMREYPQTESSHHHHHHNNNNNNNNQNMLFVWIYSTLSIFIISACGLLGVLVIPIMQKHFYQHLLQFLVALAVGTLAGDALIHLLPHALMSHSHDDSAHDHVLERETDKELHAKNMWRGFTAMGAMIFFFLMEKFLTLGTEWRKQQQLKKDKLPTRVRVMREPENAGPSSVGDKLCKHKYSSYPYCYDVIATETQDDHHHNQHINYTNPSDGINNTTSTIVVDLDSETEFLTKHPEANQNLSKCTNNSKTMKCSESNKMLAENADTHTLEDYNPPKNENSESYTVILREHINKHHGHSHTHGHVHSAPKTMSNVVWMVVMGDGLHNFTDGMAIGAAFAGSLAGGFSTAVAVFCHELPHEIGDFAVLLKAGMSAKQAIFYNMLSSLLCLLGMILGVTLGKNEAASSWLFAAAAGVFLYIALVDMIPELTTGHSKEGGSVMQCVLQFLGLLTGVTIMLFIALYEDDLKQLFED